MDGNFARCLAFTLRYEGGRSDDRRDPGGRTNQGVTQRSYASWRARHGRPARDVYAMGAAERDAIYRADFWDAVRADGIPAGADLAVFDFAVNSGPARALKAYAGRTSNDGAAIVRRVCAGRLSFLHALGTFKTFGRGWTARVAACEALGVRMAEQARIGVSPDAATPPQVAGTLLAAARAAAATARQGRRRAGAVAATGAVAHPAASAAAGLHWPAMSAAALVLGTLVALMVWRIRQSQARARAYAAAAL